MRRFVSGPVICWTTFALLAGLAGITCADDAPIVAKPANAPFRATLPAGFEKVAVGDHIAFCEPGDAAWVKQALANAKAADAARLILPDLMIRALKGKRDGLIKQMVTNLALADDKAAAALIDDELIARLNKLQAMRPPIFLLVTTREKLADLTKSGWGEPRFHYNGIAKAAAYDQNIPFSIDEPVDDTVLPIFYDDKANDQAAIDLRVKNLGEMATHLDSGLLANVARQANPVVFALFSRFIQEKAIDPLKLRRDQSWLGMGIVNYLAAKYTSQVTGSGFDPLIADLTTEPKGFAVSARAINLISPLDESRMKQAAVPYYAVSMQRKATAVVVDWVRLAGEEAIPATLRSIRGNMPADGKALVKTIAEVTRTDLTKYLEPR